MIERTLVLVKPDGVARSLVGEVIKRFEQRGLKLIGMKMVHAERDFAEKHYTDDIAKRRGEKVRDMLLSYITEGPVVALVLEGISAVNVVRKIVGDTFPEQSNVGTIRGDYAHVSMAYADEKEIAVKNLIHASGSTEEADTEIRLWFSDSELFEYETVHEKHIR
ncbi:nucleoside-diphosphate kinase [archaeon]|nr:nucleoside-diphosphate kinase [archaeon]|tara:strand:+ start:3117 stop:3608 length:492 start_codon:yes stop_codon:yes gene_type:complete